MLDVRNLRRRFASKEVHSRLRRDLLGGIGLAAFFLSMQGATASAQDYSPENAAWNGLSALMEIAQSEGIALRARDRLNLAEVTADDAIVVLFPTEGLPIRSLSAFLEEGGRLVVADDFGAAQELLSQFEIERRPPSNEAARLRGNPALQVALAEATHPLSEGVDALLTNHPTALHHPVLAPLFSLDGDGLVITGAVGAGRFIAIGDPSLFINNMLELKSNRRFASNLLHHVQGDRGQVFLLVGDATMHGAYGDPANLPPGQWVQAMASKLAKLELPPEATLWLGATLLALFLIVGATALPSASPYRSSRLFPRSSLGGGFIARVAHHSSSSGRLLHAALSYRFELERQLLDRLGLSAPLAFEKVEERLRRHGISDAEIAELKSTLAELDALAPHANSARRAPALGKRRLLAVVEVGERILKRLDTDHVHA